MKRRLKFGDAEPAGKKAPGAENAADLQQAIIYFRSNKDEEDNYLHFDEYFTCILEAAEARLKELKVEEEKSRRDFLKKKSEKKYAGTAKYVDRQIRARYFSGSYRPSLGSITRVADAIVRRGTEYARLIRDCYAPSGRIINQEGVWNDSADGLVNFIMAVAAANHISNLEAIVKTDPAYIKQLLDDYSETEMERIPLR